MKNGTFIEEGTFVYDKYLNSIGYRYILEESYDTISYAYYSVNELRIIYLELQGKVAHSSYIKLTNKDTMFSICHKIQYFISPFCSAFHNFVTSHNFLLRISPFSPLVLNIGIFLFTKPNVLKSKWFF